MRKQVSLKTYVLSIILVSVIFLAAISYIVANPSPDEIPIEKYSFQTGFSYIVFKDGSDFKVCDGSTGEITNYSTDDDTAIQTPIDDSTTNGGSVFVKAATYSASVTLKDNVTLYIEKGASSITVSIDSGATAWLYDYENDVVKRWESGSLVWSSDESWSTASYIIDKSGSNIRMKNCSSNEIEASNTNASQIINWATGNLTSGTVILLSGSYSITGTIHIASNITLVGESNTILKLDANCDMLNDKGSQNYNITISNLVLDGNDKTGDGIDFTYVVDSVISNNQIRNFTAASPNYGVRLSYSNRTYVVGNLFENNYRTISNEWYSHSNFIMNNVVLSMVDIILYSHEDPDHILITGNLFEDSGAIHLTDGDYCRIIGNTFNNSTMVLDDGSLYNVMASNTITGGSTNGIEFSTSHNNVIRGNVIYSNTGHGIKIRNSQNNTIQGNQIIGNTVDGISIQYRSNKTFVAFNNIRDNADYQIDIEDEDTCESNVIVSNYIFGANTVRDLGITTEIKRNVGFVTEASGRATVANNENVTHGLDSSLNLAQTNSTVLVTPYTTVYNGNATVVGCSAVNSTHITISARWVNNTIISTDAVQIWWSVEYSP